MNVSDCVTLLSQHAEAIRQLASGTAPDQARWKPTPDDWSILEVVNHLYDEERNDFRPKLAYMLDRSQSEPPPNDPQVWVTERLYNERDLEPSLNLFLRERESSLAWLRTLSDPDWDAAVEGGFGRLTAGDMLGSWVAHDLLHLRQLVELRFLHFQQQAKPYGLEYAGEW